MVREELEQRVRNIRFGIGFDLCLHFPHDTLSSPAISPKFDSHGISWSFVRVIFGVRVHLTPPLNWTPLHVQRWGVLSPFCIIATFGLVGREISHSSKGAYSLDPFGTVVFTALRRLRIASDIAVHNCRWSRRARDKFVDVFSLFWG